MEVLPGIRCHGVLAVSHAEVLSCSVLSLSVCQKSRDAMIPYTAYPTAVLTGSSVIISNPVIDSNGDLSHVALTVSTKTWLRRALPGDGESILVDATHSSNTAGYKLVAVGFGDSCRELYPVCFSIIMQESAHSSSGQGVEI